MDCVWRTVEVDLLIALSQTVRDYSRDNDVNQTSYTQMQTQAQPDTVEQMTCPSISINLAMLSLALSST